MSIKNQIPDIQGLVDPKAAEILRSVKTIIDTATGRGLSKKPIVKLGPDATLAGVINKVNEVIKRLQEE